MPMDSGRLAAIEARLRQLEDVEDIRAHISVYGFNADLGRVSASLDGWAEDGVLDLSEDARATGKAEIEALLNQAGAAPTQHLAANLKIKVNGDRAWAEGYSLVVAPHDGEPRILTASYNHWDFARTNGGWKMTNRTRRKLGGPTWGGEIVKSYLD